MCGGGVRSLHPSGGSGEVGGHCLFEGRYPLPNYYSGLSIPQFSLSTYFWELQTTVL